MLFSALYQHDISNRKGWQSCQTFYLSAVEHNTLSLSGSWDNIPNHSKLTCVAQVHHHRVDATQVVIDIHWCTTRTKYWETILNSSDSEAVVV